MKSPIVLIAAVFFFVVSIETAIKLQFHDHHRGPNTDRKISEELSALNIPVPSKNINHSMDSQAEGDKNSVTESWAMMTYR